MKKLLLLLTAVCSIGLSQNVEFKKSNFPDQKKEFKEALKNYKDGDYYFEVGRHGHTKALEYYQKAYDFNPNDAELNFRVGICHLNGDNKFDAFEYFDKAHELAPDLNDSIYYYLGKAHHLHKDWDIAIENYYIYEDKVKENATSWFMNADDVIERIDRRIEECKNGKKYQANPVDIDMINIGGKVNTKYPEYHVIINADETVLMFTSQRPLSEASEQQQLEEGTFIQNFEDVFETHREGKELLSWSKDKSLGIPVNTMYNDASIALSPDGHTLIVYSDRDEKGGDLYESKLDGDQWTVPIKLNENVSSPHHESSASYSFDGKSLYFVSDRPGGEGGHDIYVSRKNPLTKEWGPAKNLGPNINTPYGEQAVFAHPDGKSLYFSSQGHSTMGGFDIFKSIYNDSIGKWGEPINMGYPINGPGNDVGLVVSASGKHGYIAANQKGGFGQEDIILIDFKHAAEEHLTIFKGHVFDAKTKKPVFAKIEIFDLKKHELVAEFEANKTTGHFLVSLPAGKNYAIEVESDDHLFHSENFDLPATDTYHEVEKDIYLEPIEVGKKMVLNNVFFDYDKSTLRDESKDELGVLIKFMNQNPTIRVELSGHTDSRGNDDYNQKLSEDRAHVVVDYLIAHGILKDRLEYKGYGETQPIASNDTEEGMQLNRRTELKILSK